MAFCQSCISGSAESVLQDTAPLDGTQRRAIGLKAKQHGREHGIGEAEFAKQPGTWGAVTVAAARPHAHRCAQCRSAVRCSAPTRRSRARTFMGHSMRRAENPECISAAAERQSARAARCCGKPRWVSSATYSQIASESQTLSSRIDQQRHARRRGIIGYLRPGSPAHRNKPNVPQTRSRLCARIARAEATSWSSSCCRSRAAGAMQAWPWGGF